MNALAEASRRWKHRRRWFESNRDESHRHSSVARFSWPNAEGFTSIFNRVVAGSSPAVKPAPQGDSEGVAQLVERLVDSSSLVGCTMCARRKAVIRRAHNPETPVRFRAAQPRSEMLEGFTSMGDRDAGVAPGRSDPECDLVSRAGSGRGVKQHAKNRLFATLFAPLLFVAECSSGLHLSQVQFPVRRFRRIAQLVEQWPRKG